MNTREAAGITGVSVRTLSFAENHLNQKRFKLQ